MLQDLKSMIRDQLGLPSWLVFVAVGCAVHIALNAILRKPMTSHWGLIGVLGVGLALESYEIWVQYRSVGLFAPGNDPILAILGRHSLDVFYMASGSILFVVTGAILSKTN